MINLLEKAIDAKSFIFQIHQKDRLVGGFNPFEIGNLPQIGLKIKKNWNHHPDRDLLQLFLPVNISNQGTQSETPREKQWSWHLCPQSRLRVSGEVGDGWIYTSWKFNIAAWKIGHPKKESSLPTITFQGLC